VQRHIQLVIGRLLTDDVFRRAFLRNAQTALAEAEDGGLVLTALECTALLATERTLWDRGAKEIDGRLRNTAPAT